MRCSNFLNLGGVAGLGHDCALHHYNIPVFGCRQDNRARLERGRQRAPVAERRRAGHGFAGIDNRVLMEPAVVLCAPTKVALFTEAISLASGWSDSRVG